MKDLSLNDVLRYALAGGNFFVLFVWQFRPEVAIDSELTKSAAVLGVCLLVGSIVYVSHRAIPFPLVFLPLALRAAGYTRGTQELDSRRSAVLEKREYLRDALSEWGAQVHFLYALFWTTVMAPLIGLVATEYEPQVASWLVLTIGALYLIAAFVHNVRLAKFTVHKVEHHDA